MSEVSRTSGMVMLALAFLAAPGAAQSTREMRERVTRLERVLATRVSQDARTDSVRRAQLPVDTIRAGALRVVAHRTMTPFVTLAADSAWRTLERTFGPTAARAGKGLMVIQRTDHPTIPAPPATVLWREITIPLVADVGHLARALVGTGSHYIGTERDTAFTDWMRSELTPSLSRDDRLEMVYVEMVTSPWSKARGCFLGAAADCRAALGLSGAADPVRGWYDAADRRTKVRELPNSLWWRTMTVAKQCRDGGPDDACEAALRAAPRMSIETPLSGTARFSLLFLALESGGVGAYDRIAASANRSIGARLAAGAFLSEDSLVSLWRHRVLAARPKTVALGAGGGGAWAAVCWSVVLGVLALRSTRWR